MRIFQIYPEFQIFLFKFFFFFSGYGHRHISGSLNLYKNYFPVFFGRAILIYVYYTAFQFLYYYSEISLNQISMGHIFPPNIRLIT